MRSAHERLAPKVIRKGIEDSLRRLRTDYVDLYYAHLDDYLTPMDETLSTVSDLAKEGKVRHLGCSNFRAWRLERARQIAATNGWLAYVAWQQEFSYLRPKTGADLGETVHVDDEQLDYLKSNPEVTLIGYSPLLKGIFDDESKRRAYYNSHLFNSEDSLKRIETLSAMSKELGVSNSQLVIAWILNHQPQVIPILAASSMLQFEHNMAAMDIKLSARQMATLEAAG